MWQIAGFPELEINEIARMVSTSSVANARDEREAAIKRGPNMRGPYHIIVLLQSIIFYPPEFCLVRRNAAWTDFIFASSSEIFRSFCSSSERVLWYFA